MPPQRRARERAAPPVAAATDSIARVMVESPLPHLDRPFDYLITQEQDAAVTPGVRVRVRFAGQDVGGIVIARGSETDHAGRLTPLTRVVSSLPVLTDETAWLVRAVADRYAGTFSDVVRAAVPPRHARVEGETPDSDPVAEVAPPDSAAWSRYTGGAALMKRVSAPRGQERPRAVWTVLPDDDPAARVAELVAATARAGLGSVVVVPDARDVAQFAAAARAVISHEAVVTLAADLGPAARYRAFLSALNGSGRVVIGTRSAAFAPVVDLGLVVIWDDGDDLHSEPHAPYWHAREVLALRAVHSGAAMVMGAYSRSAEAAQALASGWAREVVAPRAVVRQSAPRVSGTSEDDEARDPAARSARLPHRAFLAAREGLSGGPVLVQVPRRGYVPALACQECRELARCGECSGPLEASTGHAIPACRWCGRLAGDFACPYCGSRRLRAITVGARRTAEELGRAFPSVPVITSGRDGIVDRVAARPALVVCTPGAEPVADGGYAAALLLDGRVLLQRGDLRSQEEAVRRWMNASALVRPSSEGGQVVVVADAGMAPVQALVRWDPAGHAVRELEQRAALRLPPAWRVAELMGEPADVATFIDVLELPPGARVLGPAPVTGTTRREVALVRALVSAEHAQGSALAVACKAAAAVRSAAKSGGPVTVRLDPVALG